MCTKKWFIISVQNKIYKANKEIYLLFFADLTKFIMSDISFVNPYSQKTLYYKFVIALTDEDLSFITLKWSDLWNKHGRPFSEPGALTSN